MAAPSIDYLPQIQDVMKRRSQFLYGLTPEDPTIKPQVDAFRNEQTRTAQRTQQTAAESASPYAVGAVRNNVRMSNERAGVNTGNFQSELMSRELANRRAMDQFFSSLGLQAEDRSRYYDALYSGVL